MWRLLIRIRKTEESEKEDPKAQKAKINGMKRFKYAGNRRSAQETDKAARVGQSRLRSEAKDLPKTAN